MSIFALTSASLSPPVAERSSTPNPRAADQGKAPRSDSVVTSPRAGAASRASEAVGIDIDSTGIRVAHVIRRRDGWHWTTRATVDHPHPLIQQRGAGESDAPSPEMVSRAVAASLPRVVDGRRRVAAVALPSSVSVLRVPADNSPDAFGASVRTDLGPSLSPGGSIQSCSWGVGRSSRKMFYAVSGSASQAAGEAIEQAGYDCRRVDSRPHAISRSLSLDASADARIAIDWGWNDCTLVFASDVQGQPFLQPSLCRSLRGYGLSSAGRIGGRSEEEDFGQMLVSMRLAADQSEHARRVADRNRALLRPLVRAAAAELIRSFRLAETLQGVDTSGPIVLCGPAAAAAELPEMLSIALDRPVRRWRWGGRSRPASHPYAPADCLFAVAIALACGETR